VRRPIALLTAAALLAGCGGGDGKKSARTVTAQPGQTVRVVADEYSFDPAKIVLASGPLTVELKNDGVLAHNLRVLRDGQDIGGTDTFQGGSTKSAQVQVQPRRYEFVCTVGNHAQLGMRGELEVGGGPAGRSSEGPTEQ
jgi:plastocyanin